MDPILRPVERSWKGRIPSPQDLPGGVLHDVVLTARHDADFLPWEAVRKRFADALGAPGVEKKRFRTVELRWPNGKLPVTVQVRKHKVRVVAGHRLTGKRLSRLVDVLGDVPHLRDLHLECAQEGFSTGDGGSAPVG